MKSLVATTLILCALLSAPVYAKDPPRPTNSSVRAPTQPQDIDPNALVRGAVQVVGLVDLGRTEELWDGGSSVIKNSTPRNAFVAEVTRTRQALGPPRQRAWMTVRRQEVLAGGASKVPPGIYATIEFATTFASNKAVLEMITLRLEQDGIWRFTGYVVKQ